MNPYFIPAEEHQFSQEIKKSQFICIITHTPTPNHAHKWIKSVREEYSDARHVCWAFIAGAPETTHQSMSDDGEPSGTAGKPMINVLQHSGLGEVATVVIRYFGGIKLGTGGLVRAYSSSVSETLKQLPLVQKTITCTINIQTEYCHESQIRHWVTQSKGEITHISYQQTIRMSCEIPVDKNPDFLQSIRPYVLQDN